MVSVVYPVGNVNNMNKDQDTNIVYYSSARAWVEKARYVAIHGKAVSADNPLKRYLGFQEGENGPIHAIELGDLKRSFGELAPHMQEWICTVEGREKMLSNF